MYRDSRGSLSTGPSGAPRIKKVCTHDSSLLCVRKSPHIVSIQFEDAKPPEDINARRFQGWNNKSRKDTD